jgi:predicted transcriptional regulator
MTGKEEILEIIQKAPEDVTLEEILETVKVLIAIKEGEAAADRGDVVPHEEVKKMLPQWIAKYSGQAQHSKT